MRYYYICFDKTSSEIFIFQFISIFLIQKTKFPIEVVVHDDASDKRQEADDEESGATLLPGVVDPASFIENRIRHDQENHEEDQREHDVDQIGRRGGGLKVLHVLDALEEKGELVHIVCVLSFTVNQKGSIWM